jgi:hypothetical protein
VPVSGGQVGVSSVFFVTGPLTIVGASGGLLTSGFEVAGLQNEPPEDPGCGGAGDVRVDVPEAEVPVRQEALDEFHEGAEGACDDESEEDRAVGVGAVEKRVDQDEGESEVGADVGHLVGADGQFQQSHGFSGDGGVGDDAQHDDQGGHTGDEGPAQPGMQQGEPAREGGLRLVEGGLGLCLGGAQAGRRAGLGLKGLPLGRSGWCLVIRPRMHSGSSGGYRGGHLLSRDDSSTVRPLR